MKRSKKVFLVLSAAVLLVCISVGATISYLTSTATVTNTFTVGSVAITLDEAKVDQYGKVIDTATRVTANTYKLLPGHTYTKDPTIHFAAGSEASYLFVKVENDIKAIESTATGYSSIASQLVTNGWTALDGVTDVYYKATADAIVDYLVFANFTIRDTVANTALATYAGESIIVTAYAVQQDGFDSAAAAWTATFGATTP